MLFICSRNQWRSPTGEKVWREKFGFETRSAGTSERSNKTVSEKDIKWADLILVMENKHKDRLKSNFPKLLKYKKIDVLDIPDDYKLMDPELVKMFEVLGEFYKDK